MRTYLLVSIFVLLVTFASVNSILTYFVILFTLNIDGIYVLCYSYFFFLHLPCFVYRLILKIGNTLTDLILNGGFYLLVIHTYSQPVLSSAFTCSGGTHFPHTPSQRRF